MRERQRRFSRVLSFRDSTSEHADARRAIGWGVLLIAALVVTYFSSLGGDFLWDDDSHVTANPCIVGPLGLKEIWTTAAANYFPLVLTNFWLQHALWGLDPLGYHLVTLAFHALAAVLFWQVLRQLRVPGAWLGAALWALHPVQVESVAWICELKNTQSAVFFLLAIRFFMRWLGPSTKTTVAPGVRGTGGAGSYSAALLCALLALLSKPSTVMLPIVLALCAWWLRGELRWRDARALAPFFVLSAIAAGWTIWEQKFHSAALGAEWNQSLPERLAVAGRVPWFYLAKLIWPQPLVFIYPRWQIDGAQVAVFLPLAVGLTMLMILWRRRRGSLRPVFLAAAYFVALLFPVLGFFSIYFFRYSYVSDHFQYLASMGPLALAGGMLARLRHPWSLVVAGVMLAALALQTWRHTANFANNETLWRATLAHHPGAGMAWLNLGATLAKQGRDAEAIASFMRVAELRPDDADAQNDAGWGLFDAGYPEPAVPLLERALRLDPDHIEARNTLGNALRRLGRRDEAISHYARALALKRGSAEAHNNLGSMFAESGRIPEAIEHFEAALRVEPRFAPAHANLGTALGLAGRWREAIGPLQAALRLQPDYPDAHGKLAVALANTGQLEGAVHYFEQALRLSPRAAEVHLNFAHVLRTLGRTREAEEHFAAAARFQRGR